MSLNKNQKEKLLNWAMEWMDYGPEREDSIRSGFEKHKQRYSFRKLAEETFPIHEMKATPDDIRQNILFIIQDLSFEKGGVMEDTEPHISVEESISEDGLIETYHSKVNEVVKSIGRSEEIFMEIIFPLNILTEPDIEKINIFDMDFKQVNESKWKKVIKEFKKYPDVHNAHIAESLCEDGNFTYWKTEIAFERPRYASDKFRTAVKLLLAEINHCLHLWESELANNPQWSRISEPFCVLLEVNNTPEEVSIVDRDPNEPVEIEWLDSEFRNLFDKFPSFEHNPSGTEEVLQNALLEYQRAVVETDRHDAFMSFWRCTEGLSLAGNGEKDEIVNRANWALRNTKDENKHIEFIETVSNEMYDARNNWVHEPNWNEMKTSYEYVAKYFCDAMIQMYIEKLFDKDVQLVKSIFDLSTMEEPQRENELRNAMHTQKALDGLSSIESE